MTELKKANIPGEIIEHRQDQKSLRNEAKYFWDDQMQDDGEQVFKYSNPFNPDVQEDNLLPLLTEMMVKSQVMLNQVGEFGAPYEEVKYLEMSLNKTGSMMEKCKVIIFSVGSLFIILPFKISKIEVRTRNMLINSKNRFENIAKFIPVYLAAHEL